MVATDTPAVSAPGSATVGPAPVDLDELLDRVLDRAVAKATGNPAARARPGQRVLAHDLLAAMRGRKHHAGSAPTGSGKGFSYLCPAMLLAAMRGQRTVVSTESLGLQAQIIEKDAPVVAAAVEEITGRCPDLAVLKGWSNYACFGHDTEILTYGGVRNIGDLAGTTERVLDGNGVWVEAEIRDFGVQQIVEVAIGQQGRGAWTIDTTSNHRWFVQKNADYPAVQATTMELGPGDRLSYVGPKNRSLGKMAPSTFGIAHGVVFGDGSRLRSTDGGLHPGACNLKLHGKKNWPLVEFVNGAPRTEPQCREGYTERIITVGGLPSFFQDKPSLAWNTSYLYGWLAGYFAADGSVSIDGSPRLDSACRDNLRFVTEVCAHLGIDHGRIAMQMRASLFTGTEKTPMYKLPIAARSLAPDFFLIDEHRRRFMLRKSKYRPEQARRRHTVRSVTVTERYERVFCAIVPTTGSFVLAGNILTGNCSLAVAATVQDLTGSHSRDLGELGAALDTRQLSMLPGAAVSMAAEQIEPLARWALEEIAAGRPGDRGSYPAGASNPDWATVSTTPAECPGTTRCQFGSTCRPAKSREVASEADVVVTNHSMLAVQAATSAPIVLGNINMGEFDHLVMDEAHAMTAQVRSQGSVSLNAWRVSAVLRAVEKVLVDDDSSRTKSNSRLERLSQDGSALATVLDRHLTELLAGTKGRDGVLKVGPDDDPLGPLADQIQGWIGRAKRLVPAPGTANTTVGTVALYRTHARLSELAAEVTEATRHFAGQARWVEPGNDRNGSDRGGTGPTARRGGWSGATLKLAPVDVSGPLRSNLYARGPMPDDRQGGQVVEEPLGVSVSAVSATLPAIFVRDLGLDAVVKDYPSPFDAAYRASLCFVPRMDPADPRCPTTLKGARASFDTGKHPAWAVGYIVELVAANNGSALVLASTVAAGKLYAERLRAYAAGPGAPASWSVHSQWDGPAVRSLVSQWRDDHGSVLVGTKSLMTGVDAPGGTCTLVIVDRVPRAAGNPIDDARVERAATRMATDRWAADRLVYVADAGLLLEQAAGRLIRSVTDSGLVAVLDPRLLRQGPVVYPGPTRQLLLKALDRFEHKTADLDVALAWLRARRAALTSPRVSGSGN